MYTPGVESPATAHTLQSPTLGTTSTHVAPEHNRIVQVDVGETYVVTAKLIALFLSHGSVEDWIVITGLVSVRAAKAYLPSTSPFTSVTNQSPRKVTIHPELSPVSKLGLYRVLHVGEAVKMVVAVVLVVNMVVDVAVSVSDVVNLSVSMVSVVDV